MSWVEDQKAKQTQPSKKANDRERSQKQYKAETEKKEKRNDSQYIERHKVRGAEGGGKVHKLETNC
jgi:hypothetical protein